MFKICNKKLGIDWGAKKLFFSPFGVFWILSTLWTHGEKISTIKFNFCVMLTEGFLSKKGGWGGICLTLRPADFQRVWSQKKPSVRTMFNFKRFLSKTLIASMEHDCRNASTKLSVNEHIYEFVVCAAIKSNFTKRVRQKRENIFSYLFPTFKWWPFECCGLHNDNLRWFCVWVA